MHRGGERDAVYVYLVEIACGAAAVELAGTSDATVHAGHQAHERSGIARRTIHDQGQVGVFLLLHRRAEGCIFGLKERRRGIDGDRFGDRSKGELRVVADGLQGVDGDMLLGQGAEAGGRGLDRVLTGCERRKHVVAGARCRANGDGVVVDVGRSDGRSGNRSAGCVRDGTGDGSLAADLSLRERGVDQRRKQKKQRENVAGETAARAVRCVHAKPRQRWGESVAAFEDEADVRSVLKHLSIGKLFYA